MPVHEIIGWFGSIFFAFCGFPQVIHTWKTRKTDDLSEMFLWLWFLGEIFTIYYLIHEDQRTGEYHWPLYFNYFLNLIMVCYLLFARYKYATLPTILGRVLQNFKTK